MTDARTQRLQADALRMCRRLGEMIVYRFADGSQLKVPAIVDRGPVQFETRRRGLVKPIEIDVPKALIASVHTYGDGGARGHCGRWRQCRTAAAARRRADRAAGDADHRPR